TTVSANGRQFVLMLDALGRPIQGQLDDIEPVHQAFDNHGFLAAIGQGSGNMDRIFTFGRDSRENLTAITSPVQATTSYGVDDAGRITSRTLPGGQRTTVTYYADGNLRTVTPAGILSHTITYTPTGLVGAYMPPDIGTGSTTVMFNYNLDAQ